MSFMPGNDPGTILLDFGKLAFAEFCRKKYVRRKSVIVLAFSWLFVDFRRKTVIALRFYDCSEVLRVLVSILDCAP